MEEEQEKIREKLLNKDTREISYFYKRNVYDSREINLLEDFIKEKNLYSYCLLLLYCINNNREFTGAEIAIEKLAHFLSHNFSCSLNINYVMDNKCPYEDKNCDHNCSPSINLNCEMNPIREYLTKSKEEFEQEILNEIKNKKVDLDNFHINGMENCLIDEFEKYRTNKNSDCWKDEDNYYGYNEDRWSGAGNYWGEIGEYTVIRCWDDKTNYKDPTEKNPFPYGNFEGAIEERPGRKIIAKICGYLNYSGQISMAGKHIKIPSYIRDIPVAIIGQFVFSGIEMKSISLPKELQIIEAAAFSNNKLSELELPESLIELNLEAFSKNNFKEILVPKNVKKIIEAFSDNPLEKITLPSDVEVIGHRKDCIWAKFCSYYIKNKKRGGSYIFDGNSWLLHNEN